VEAVAVRPAVGQEPVHAPQDRLVDGTVASKVNDAGNAAHVLFCRWGSGGRSPAEHFVIELAVASHHRVEAELLDDAPARGLAVGLP